MRKRKSRVVSEVNVTSLVDVTMVLLIIFIIAAPFMRSGVKVDLPEAARRDPQDQRSILITIDRQSAIFVNNERTSMENLVPAIKRLQDGAPKTPVMIEGDQSVVYGEVIRVMDAIRQAGIENVGLVLQPVRRR